MIELFVWDLCQRGLPLACNGEASVLYGWGIEGKEWALNAGGEMVLGGDKEGYEGMQGG